MTRVARERGWYPKNGSIYLLFIYLSIIIYYYIIYLLKSSSKEVTLWWTFTWDVHVFMSSVFCPFREVSTYLFLNFLTNFLIMLFPRPRPSSQVLVPTHELARNAHLAILVAKKSKPLGGGQFPFTTVLRGVGGWFQTGLSCCSIQFRVVPA